MEKKTDFNILRKRIDLLCGDYTERIRKVLKKETQRFVAQGTLRSSMFLTSTLEKTRTEASDGIEEVQRAIIAHYEVRVPPPEAETKEILALMASTTMRWIAELWSRMSALQLSKDSGDQISMFQARLNRLATDKTEITISDITAKDSRTRTEHSGSPATTSLLHKEEESLSAEYIFQQRDDSWHISFDGEEAFIKNRKGLSYIHHLLSHPNSKFSPIDLIRVVSPPSELPHPSDSHDDHDSTSSQQDGFEMLDGRALRDLRNRIAELDKDLESSQTAPQEKALLEKERADIVSHLEKSTNITGRIRRERGDQDRARSAVRQSIGRAIDLVEKKSPEVGKHLREKIVTGSTCTYHLPPQMTWKT